MKYGRIHGFRLFLKWSHFLHEHTNVYTDKAVGLNNGKLFLHGPQFSPHVPRLLSGKQFPVKSIVAHQVQEFLFFVNFNGRPQAFINWFQAPLKVVFVILSQILVVSNAAQRITWLFKTLVKSYLSDSLHAIFWQNCLLQSVTVLLYFLYFCQTHSKLLWLVFGQF